MMNQTPSSCWELVPHTEGLIRIVLKDLRNSEAINHIEYSRLFMVMKEAGGEAIGEAEFAQQLALTTIIFYLQAAYIMRDKIKNGIHDWEVTRFSMGDLKTSMRGETSFVASNQMEIMNYLFAAMARIRLPLKLKECILSIVLADKRGQSQAEEVGSNFLHPFYADYLTIFYPRLWSSFLLLGGTTHFQSFITQYMSLLWRNQSQQREEALDTQEIGSPTHIRVFKYQGSSPKLGYN